MPAARLALFPFVVTLFGLLLPQYLPAQDAPAQTTSPSPPLSTPATTPPAPSAPSLPTANAPATSQPIAYDTEPLPRDPAAALLLASKANGLGGEGLKPWYLKAHYQTYDAQGKPASKGVFELYWSGYKQYRVSYQSSSFAQVFYHLESGDYRAGSSGRLPYSESQVLQALLSPIPSRIKTSVRWSNDARSNTSLACLQVGDVGSSASAYCLTPNKPYLRTSEIRDHRTVFNKISAFQVHFVGESIAIYNSDRAVLKFEVDELRVLAPADLQAFTPTADALPLSLLDALSSGNLHTAPDGKSPAEQLGLVPPRLLKSKDPDYPAEVWREAHGHAEILVRVGTDGLVHDPVVVSDPEPKNE